MSDSSSNWGNKKQKPRLFNPRAGAFFVFSSPPKSQGLFNRFFLPPGGGALLHPCPKGTIILFLPSGGGSQLPRPLLVLRRGTSPPPNLPPHGGRLKLGFAETAEPSCVLVSRDTRYIFYRLSPRINYSEFIAKPYQKIMARPEGAQGCD
jgi:hypothetical protein